MQKSNETIPNVPTLRFPEFDGEWQQEQMKGLCSFYKGYGISKEDLGCDGLPCILYGELYTTYKTAIAKNIKSRTSIEDDNLFHSKANDVVIPCSGETAIDIATSVCIPYDDILIGGDLTVIRSSLDGAFLSNQINGARRKQIAKIAQGASIVHLHADNLKEITLFFPSAVEQHKIAHFIDLLDERIEVQNKIIKDLKILKKELCCKLFSWEKCDQEIEVKQIASVIGGYAFNSKSYIENGKYKIVTIGNVTGSKYISGEYNSIDELPKNLQKQQLLNKGDILVSLTGNVGRISIVSGENYLLNQRVAKLHISDSLLKEYIYQYLSQSSFEKDMILSGQGAAQKNIKNNDILQYLIRIPTNTDTLKAIVTLLLIFDKKIINEEKLALIYHKLKGCLLNNMFI